MAPGFDNYIALDQMFSLLAKTKTNLAIFMSTESMFCRHN